MSADGHERIFPSRVFSIHYYSRSAAATGVKNSGRRIEVQSLPPLLLPPHNFRPNCCCLFPLSFLGYGRTEEEAPIPFAGPFLLFRRKSATYDGRALKCFKNWEKERRGGDGRIGKEEKGL